MPTFEEKLADLITEQLLLHGRAATRHDDHGSNPFAAIDEVVSALEHQIATLKEEQRSLPTMPFGCMGPT